MNIIDNFGIPSKSREGFNPWLENVLDIAQELGKDKEMTVRLTAIRTNTSITYLLRNSQNKTSAKLYKKNKIYHLQLYKRELPNAEKSIKPDSILVSEFVYRLGTMDEFKEIATKLVEHMTSETPYSIGTVTKIKVVPAQDQWSSTVFLGGQITRLIYNQDDTIDVTVENGQACYRIKRSDLGKARINPLKYIIINKEKFQLINSLEFDYYYKMISPEDYANTVDRLLQ